MTMNTVALGLAAGSFGWTLGTVVAYLRTIPRNTVPVEVTSLRIKLVLGMALGAAAIAWSLHSSGSVSAIVIAPVAFAAMLASFILWLLSQRKVPAGDLQVKLGDKLLAFAASSSEGSAFHSDELAGKRTLLKFFRGGW